MPVDNTRCWRVRAARFHSGWRALTWLLQFRRVTGCQHIMRQLHGSRPSRRSHFRVNAWGKPYREWTRTLFHSCLSRPFAAEGLFEDQDCCCYYCCPQTTLVADSSLRDVGGPDDFVGDPVDFLLFVPGLVGVKLT